MVNGLKEVTKVTKDINYALGIFEISLEKLPFKIVDFIYKVSTNNDMCKEGSRFYKWETI